MLNADGWWLEGEGFGLGEGRLAFLGVLCGGVVLAVLGSVNGVVVEVGGEGGGHGRFLKARGVRCGLATELGKVEV